MLLKILLEQQKQKQKQTNVLFRICVKTFQLMKTNKKAVFEKKNRFKSINIGQPCF